MLLSETRDKTDFVPIAVANGRGGHVFGIDVSEEILRRLGRMAQQDGKPTNGYVQALVNVAIQRHLDLLEGKGAKPRSNCKCTSGSHRAPTPQTNLKRSEMAPWVPSDERRAFEMAEDMYHSSQNGGADPYANMDLDGLESPEDRAFEALQTLHEAGQKELGTSGGV